MGKKDDTEPDKLGSPLKTAPNGLLVFASRGRVITPEMIRQAEEDDLNDEIDRMLSLGGRSLKSTDAENNNA